jgi:hypothetical protein
MAHARAAPPIVAGNVRGHEQRLAPTSAPRAQEAPAAERPGIAANECEPRVRGRVPALKRCPVTPVEVWENISDVQASARLNDMCMALGPLVDLKAIEGHLGESSTPAGA